MAPSFAEAACTDAERSYAGAVPSRGVVQGTTGGRQAEQLPLVPLSASSQRPPPRPGPARRPLRATAGIILTRAAGRVFGTFASKSLPLDAERFRNEHHDNSYDHRGDH